MGSEAIGVDGTLDEVCLVYRRDPWRLMRLLPSVLPRKYPATLPERVVPLTTYFRYYRYLRNFRSITSPQRVCAG